MIPNYNLLPIFFDYCFYYPGMNLVLSEGPGTLKQNIKNKTIRLFGLINNRLIGIYSIIRAWPVWQFILFNLQVVICFHIIIFEWSLDLIPLLIHKCKLTLFYLDLKAHLAHKCIQLMLFYLNLKAHLTHKCIKLVLFYLDLKARLTSQTNTQICS